jgi:hypothetical protein
LQKVYARNSCKRGVLILVSSAFYINDDVLFFKDADRFVDVCGVVVPNMIVVVQFVGVVFVEIDVMV